MADIIDLAARRNNRLERFRNIIELVFARGQTLIVGCDDREKKYNELRSMFPDAELEIVGIGVKIWKKN